MTNDWVDFREIKQTVAINQVLSHYGIKLRPAGPNQLRGRCPLPTHTSKQSADSFSVNLARRAWSCQSLSCTEARGGRVGGNVLDLVSAIEGCSIREAALRLQAWFGSLALNPQRQAPIQPSTEPIDPPNRPLGFVLHNVDWRHPYLASRGITSETARSFGLGLYQGTGFLKGRVVVPIHNECDELIAYAGRAVDGEEPKYRFPAGFRKSQVLYNLNRAIHTGNRTVIAVEGFFDTLKVHQAGHSAVVALMGSTLSARQAELLASHFHQVLLMLDGDLAGQQGAEAAAHSLQPKVDVSVIRLSPGVQPDQLASNELNHLLRGLTNEIHPLER
jgi:DNA primase